MQYLIFLTFLLSVCYISAQQAAIEQAVDINSFADLFPTLFRLKRSAIENEDDSTESIAPPPSKQFQQYLFQLILQTHGLNLGDLRDIYVESNGDAETVIAKLNEAIGSELLYIDAEDLLRINTDEYLLFFNGFISRITKENPYLETLVNNVLKPYISNLQVNVREFRVPIDAVFARVKSHLNRSRRSLNIYEISKEGYINDDQIEFVRGLLQVIADWLRNAAKAILKQVIVQLNNATFNLFSPAFDLLQNFLFGIIDAIKITI